MRCYLCLFIQGKQGHWVALANPFKTVTETVLMGLIPKASSGATVKNNELLVRPTMTFLTLITVGSQALCV